MNQSERDANPSKSGTSLTARTSSFYLKVFEQLLGVPLKTTLTGTRSGKYQDFIREWSRTNRGIFWTRAECQTLVFQKDGESCFFIVGPTATFLVFLEACLGVDIEKLCSDARLWRDFEESLRKSPRLTSLEREVLLYVAPRFGVFNRQWYDDGVLCGKRKQDWTTRLIDGDLRRDADSMRDGFFTWEHLELIICGRTLPLSFVRLMEESSPQSSKDNDEDSFIVELPNFDLDEKITATVRVASGCVKSEVWQTLGPGEVLTTDAPADKLFDMLINDKVVFHVQPGLFHGRPAVQIREKAT